MVDVQRGVDALVAALHRLALAETPDEVQDVAVSAGEALSGPHPVLVSLREALDSAATVALQNVELRQRLAAVDTVTDVNRQLEQEIEEHWRFAAEVFHQSVTDDLTGLYNRRGFVKRAESELAALRDQGKPGMCLFLDLDGLKELNDSDGHEAGDQLLRDAAELLRALFREHDVLARIGGDEFAVFVPGYADVTSVVERLRRRSGRVRMSIGAAVFDPVLPQSLYELLGAADADMYGDKRARRTG